MTKPGALVSGGLAVLTLLLTPAWLGRLVSLDWVVGNLRPAAYAMQGVCAILAVLAWRWREGLDRLLVRWLPTRREAAFAAVTVVASLTATGAAVEALMRSFDLPFPGTWTPPENARAHFDPELGWAYIAGWSGNQRLNVKGARVEVPMRFDTHAARVASTGPVADPQAPTVLFVGCSFTAGFGVPYEDTFAGQLGAMPGFPLQVVNLGVEAYGTDQALLMLRRHVHRFNTKAVVYTFISDHVPRNHNADRRLLFRQARFLGTKPLFGLAGDGELVLERTPARYEELAYSRLAATAELAWTRWGPKPTLDLTRALVAEMRRVAEVNGAVFVLTAWDWDRSLFFPEAGDWPPFRDLGIRIVDTAAGAPPDWPRWRIPGDSHPNPAAHARVAHLLFDAFRDLGLAQAPKTVARPASGYPE